MTNSNMVTTKMMWILAAGLGLGACGNVQSSGSGGDDVAGDAGVAEGAVTIDRTGFFDDGDRWLASSSGPMVQGSIGGDGTVVVTLDGANISGVVTAGGHWSVMLPDGSLATASKVLAVKIEGKDDSEVTQPLALDTSMPSITAMPTSIRDERGDTLAFTANGPAHTHAGPTIALGGAGCASVYKYGYLLGAQAPQYGSEVSPNPLSWKFHADGRGIGAQGAQYRVRRDGAVVLDWTPMVADQGTDYTVTLHRDGEHAVPTLGTTAGNYTLDVRVHDWQEREVSASTCWDHHPLAAPLQVGHPEAAGVGASLLNFTVASPLSRLVLAGSPVNVFATTITQTTAEPVHVRFGWQQPTGSFTTTVAIDWVAPVDQAGLAIDCGITCPFGASGCEPEPATDPRCASGVPADPADLAIGGAIPAGHWLVTVLDAETMQPFAGCTGGVCDLPGRAAGAGAREFVVIASVDGLSSLQPWAGGIGEYALEALPYTGMSPAESATTTRCATKSSTLTSRGNKITCTSTRTYTKLTAYDHLHLAWNPSHLDMQTATVPSAPLAAPAYLPQGIAGASFVWDGGDSDLPGTLH